MTDERQDKLNQMAEQAQLAQGQAECVGYAGHTQSMRDRLDCRRADLERRAQQSDKLRELVTLLDKNPEVARILELFEEVGDY